MDLRIQILPVIKGIFHQRFHGGYSMTLDTSL